MPRLRHAPDAAAAVAPQVQHVVGADGDPRVFVLANGAGRQEQPILSTVGSRPKLGDDPLGKHG